GTCNQACRHAVVGLHEHTTCVVADELAQTAAKLQCGAPVEAEHKYRARWDTLDAQQVRATMHDHARLAGPWSRQHEQRLVVAGLDDAPLVFAEVLDDAAPRVGAGRSLQLSEAPLEVALQELLARQP